MSWEPCTECRQPAGDDGLCAVCRRQIAEAAAETIEIMRVGALKSNPSPAPNQAGGSSPSIPDVRKDV